MSFIETCQYLLPCVIYWDLSILVTLCVIYWDLSILVTLCHLLRLVNTCYIVSFIETCQYLLPCVIYWDSHIYHSWIAYIYYMYDILELCNYWNSEYNLLYFKAENVLYGCHVLLYNLFLTSFPRPPRILKLLHGSYHWHIDKLFCSMLVYYSYIVWQVLNILVIYWRKKTNCCFFIAGINECNDFSDSNNNHCKLLYLFFWSLTKKPLSRPKQ